MITSGKHSQNSMQTINQQNTNKNTEDYWKHTTQINNQEFDLVDQYLDLDLSSSKQHHEAIFSSQPQQEIHVASTNSLPNQDANETSTQKKKKSIFHNFQKHLITLLKKNVSISSRSFEGKPLRQVALSLWQIFTRSKSGNKKILHIIFGTPQTPSIQQELELLAKDFKDFRNIRNKRSTEDILRGQEMIRQEVFRQAENINFSEVQCQVSRMEFFKEYVNSFLGELSQGPLSKRMTKKQKEVVVDHIRAVAQ